MAKDSKAAKDYLDKNGKIRKEFYQKELAKMQSKLVKLQYWVKARGLKVVILFEGRDAAGKGGTIKRVSEPLNPRGCRVVALEKPTEKEQTQWYFQRYVAHLPSAGEIVLFDRSWYNRAGVDTVMGYCTEAERQEFFQSCPEFEKMLVRSGIILLKYWFSVSEKEQEARFRERSDNPNKRWKLSPVDIASWNRWDEYSKAKDEMFHYTDTDFARWWCIDSDDKKAARLNCISHILKMIPYEDVTPKPLVLPPRPQSVMYNRPDKNRQNYVVKVY